MWPRRLSHPPRDPCRRKRHRPRGRRRDRARRRRHLRPSPGDEAVRPAGAAWPRVGRLELRALPRCGPGPLHGRGLPGHADRRSDHHRAGGAPPLRDGEEPAQLAPGSPRAEGPRPAHAAHRGRAPAARRVPPGRTTRPIGSTAPSPTSAKQADIGDALNATVRTLSRDFRALEYFQAWEERHHRTLHLDSAARPRPSWRR